MRRNILSIVMILLPVIAQADPLLRNRDVVAVCGDSITEQRIYSMFIETYLLACKPRTGLRADQFGWSGEVAPAFATRIGSDVLPLHPTFATLCYGMNDGHYTAMTPQTGDTFRAALKDVVVGLKKGGVRTMVIGSPGCVDSTTFKRPSATPDVYNETLQSLSDIAKDIARENDQPFADVHGIMMKVMADAKAKYGDKFAFAGNDGVHPQQAGHLVMAYAFLKAMNCKGDIGTITLDFSMNQNIASDGHHILSAQNNTVVIESTRWPFCFLGDGKSANSERSVAQLFPFDPDLNRFMLIVKNLGPGQVRVTWNDQSKTYSAEALAKGINLADEFIDENPFTTSIGDLEKLVSAQQEFETMLTKTLLHNADEIKKSSPDAAPKVSNFLDSALRLDDALFDAAQRKAQSPIRHTIKIEPVP